MLLRGELRRSTYASRTEVNVVPPYHICAHDLLGVTLCAMLSHRWFPPGPGNPSLFIYSSSFLPTGCPPLLEAKWGWTDANFFYARAVGSPCPRSNLRPGRGRLSCRKLSLRRLARHRTIIYFRSSRIMCTLPPRILQIPWNPLFGPTFVPWRASSWDHQPNFRRSSSRAGVYPLLGSPKRPPGTLPPLHVSSCSAGLRRHTIIYFRSSRIMCFLLPLSLCSLVCGAVSCLYVP